MAGSHKFHDQYSVQDVKRAVISAAGLGDNTIVAAVAGKKIRVLSYIIGMVGTSTSHTWQSGAAGTNLTGALLLGQGSVYSAPYNPLGWFESAAGVLLNLSLGAAQQVSGVVNYVLVDADGRE